jgi:hypothetical protein
MTWVVLRRALGLETSSCGGFTGWFMGPQISGFGDIHHGAGGSSVRIITVWDGLEFFVHSFNSLVQPFRSKARGCRPRYARRYIGPESRD